MMPSIEHVARVRYTLTAVIRLGGLFMLVLAMRPTFSWLWEGLIDDDLLDTIYYLDRILSAAALSLSGLFMVLFANRLARVLTPIPRNECPQCQYLLTYHGGNRCPECGLQLRPPLAEAEPIELQEVDDTA